MSLNSVVNNLVRAAAGIPADISDGDLDRHVAELLAKEAKERDAKWSEIGLGGLLGNDRSQPDPNAPKPNKRFLASIIKTVDNHNSTVIRQQLEAASTARSNSGLGESSRSAASRMFGGAMRDVGRRPVKGRGMRSDDTDRGRGREEWEREQRWHDKRAGSRERRTRYDVGEEEEMMNNGMEGVPESKERQDWTKRKNIRDEERRKEREREREEGSEDENERRKRRSRLYGDEEESRGSRRYEKEESRSSRRQDEDESGRRNERRKDYGEHEGENRRDRRRRRREEAEVAAKVEGTAVVDGDDRKPRRESHSPRHRRGEVDRSPKRRHDDDPIRSTPNRTSRREELEQEPRSRRHRRDNSTTLASPPSRSRRAESGDESHRSSRRSRREEDHSDSRLERRSKDDDTRDEVDEQGSASYRRRSHSPNMVRKEKRRHRDDSPRNDRFENRDRTSGRRRESPSNEIDEPIRSSQASSPPKRKSYSTRIAKSPTPGPPSPPPNAAPPPPDTPPPSPPPVPSKMDKYFDEDYDPRLDLGEVPRNGYVPEVGWDNMLAVLKERGKKPRNRSPGLYDDPMEIPKIKLRRSPSPTLKELEKAEKRAKRAMRGYDDDCETEAERSKRKADRRKEKEERARVTALGPGDGGGLFDVEYVKKGGVREWDMGK